MNRRRTRTFAGVALAIVLAAAAVWLENERPPRAAGSRRPPPPPAGTTWQSWSDCRLARDAANDGDSFLVEHSGGRHTVRLYFVDCCEKRRHPQNRARLADQGAYFGGMSESSVLRLGRQARDEVLKLLEGQPFDVTTRWESVYDSGRYYAHVAVKLPDGTRRSLPEWLVERGLARIHTKGESLPDGTPERQFRARLREIEREARLARRGGWAQSAPDTRE